MSVKVKELAEFHSINVDVMQAIYDDITLLIVRECADYVRETYDHEAAESIAWSMEVKYGLHGDYV